MHAALPRWMTTLSLCRRKVAALESPEFKDMRQPISEMNLVASGPHGLRVSAATGTKERPGLNDEYFLSSSAFVLALPGIQRLMS